MSRCLALLFALLACVAPALAQGPIACGAGCALTVRGRLMDPTAVPPDGVACCLIDVGVRIPIIFAESQTVRTRADGTFSACFDCNVPGQVRVSVQPRCCQVRAEQVRNGDVVDMGDISCADPPVTNSTALMGSVVCRSGALIEPVADCSVLVDALPSRNGVDGYSVTRTDANGDYEVCLDCAVGGGAITVNRIEAQCCGQVERPDVVPCEERHRVPTMICAPCPVPPCNLPEEIEIRGALACDLDGDADMDPIAGCAVALSIVGARGTVVQDVAVTTSLDGVYRACVPCPADDDLAGWTLVARPECCNDTFSQEVIGCPPVIDMGFRTCCPSDDCPASQTRVRGRLTCVDPSRPTPLPLGGCVAFIEPLNCGFRRVTVVTDANGEYGACLTCAGCDRVLVTSQCCPAAAIAPLSCSRESVVDLTCTTCPAGAACAGQQEIHGRVTCRDELDVLQPLAGYEVVVGCQGNSVRATTDANGNYVACLPCGECGYINVVGACSALYYTTPDCSPLAADLDCGRPCAPPQRCPGQQEVRGRVACTSPGGVPQAVAGCGVRVECASDPSINVVATTDAAGNYSACLPCNACLGVRATALCCNASTLVQLSPACPPVTADISCGPCQPPPNPCSPEQTISGRVTCDSNGDGMPDPLVGCSVRVSCIDGGAFTTIVTTDGDGEYVACIPCTSCTLARVTALCCGASATVALTPPNCVPARADLACLACPAPSPCGPSEQAIAGRVTCRDAGGLRVPQVGCEVRVECPGAQSVTVTTDINGDYVACLPCGACALAIVTPLCCGQPVTVQLDPIACPPVTQDIDCGACALPPPCPRPGATAVHGALICRQNGAPFASAVITLQALDAGGNPLPDVTTALTDGAGQYHACVPCPNDIASIRATAHGCGASSGAPALGCPETLSLGVMECDGCSPCPRGSTRLQGRIHCRAGGPVAGCALRVVVTTCDETLVVEVMTDVEGRYRLCIPCPCDDTDVRVTALCCNASRAVHVDRCGPILAVPTLVCPSPCR